jgi:hypothetical protein
LPHVHPFTQQFIIDDLDIGNSNDEEAFRIIIC